MAYRMIPANARMRQQTVSRSPEEVPEVTPEDVAEDQEKPELQAVKDFVNNLDSTQFGYLQECIQKRLEAGMDEVDKADAKPAEMVFDEMATENENSQRMENK